MSFLLRIYGIKFQNILSLWLLPSLLGHTTKNCLLIRNQIRCFMIHQRSTIKGSKVKSAASKMIHSKIIGKHWLGTKPSQMIHPKKYCQTLTLPARIAFGEKLMHWPTLRTLVTVLPLSNLWNWNITWFKNKRSDNRLNVNQGLGASLI